MFPAPSSRGRVPPSSPPTPFLTVRPGPWSRGRAWPGRWSRGRCLRGAGWQEGSGRGTRRRRRRRRRCRTSSAFPGSPPVKGAASPLPFHPWGSPNASQCPPWGPPLVWGALRSPPPPTLRVPARRSPHADTPKLGMA